MRVTRNIMTSEAIDRSPGNPGVPAGVFVCAALFFLRAERSDPKLRLSFRTKRPETPKMTHKGLVIAISALSLVLAAEASAASKKKPPQPQPQSYPQADYAPAPSPSRSSMEPARMYEVRPGMWISTYDCVTDDGYGRIRPCSAGGDKTGN